MRKSRDFYRDIILDLLGPICVNCGDSDPKNLEIDHITPLSKDGLNKLQNLQVLCTACHSRKTKREGLYYHQHTKVGLRHWDEMLALAMR